MYKMWGNIFHFFYHAFDDLSLLHVDFVTTPTLMEYTKVMTYLAKSPRHIHMTFGNELPIFSNFTLFDFSAFRYCQSVNIECKRMKRTPQGVLSRREYVGKICSDIISFLHDGKQRTLNIRPQFTSNEVYNLAANLQYVCLFF